MQEPSIVVAHGLTCAFAVMCAYRRPSLFEKLILVSPPTALLDERQPDPASTAFKAVLQTPIVGEFVYNLLTSRRAIQSYFDYRGYHNPGLTTDQLVEDVFTTAHQANSYLPAAALYSRDLVSDIHEPLARLRVPVVAIWGREENIPPQESTAAYQQVFPGLETRIIDHSRQQLQDEQASRFNALVLELASATVQP
jgi:pimeloyl-ACP methyl ester carboxylesterase